MKKEEIIRRYGEEGYRKHLLQNRERARKYPQNPQASLKWRVAHPEKVKANEREKNRKGGRYYEQRKDHQASGIPHEKELVRNKHQEFYRPYKKIIAPDSELHHSWLNDRTAGYSGVALVEKDQHRHGYIDVIQILEGEITLLTEAEIRAG